MFFDRSETGSNRPLLAFILATLVVGAVGSIFTEPSIPTWYAALLKPGFSPPNWLFAPVWTALYLLMAEAAWRVWRITGLKSPEILLYVIQLAFNLLWSILFFGLHAIFWALADLGLLLALIAGMLAAFWRRDRLAGALMLPYLGWSAFAFLLNLAIWRLNGPGI
jgi:tryptophan-rich sensory protein